MKSTLSASRYLLLPGLLLLAASFAQAQFLDDFDERVVDPRWQSFTGDGQARLTFSMQDGMAQMRIDASDDVHNVWWAIIKRNVAEHLDMKKLADPNYELRVEARIRVSNAPRRVNFMINTQRTTDFHRHLREYDIPNASQWHTISMTTDGLDAKPGDDVNVQLSATDWGLGQYHLDVDYYRAEVVRAADAQPDVGEPLVYHPAVPSLAHFEYRRPADQDVVLNRTYPEVNFDGWRTQERNQSVPVLTVSADQWVLLRWDLESLESAQAKGAGVLELTTHSLQRGGNYAATYGEDLGMEFDKVRVYEVFGGPESWEQKTLTYNGFIGGRPIDALVNGQMIFDVAPAQERGEKTHITLSRPVLQRLLDGTTRGLLIRPLGAIEATFYDSQGESIEHAPTLYFNVE